ncbi:MAG: hypothetical protein PHG19_04065 [Anaerotignum sp.]|nr:hypothetical protein [Anaerotignum sp.]
MNEIEAIEIIKKVDICCNAAETARDLAIQALQEKLEQENQKPLTLEELRCMDGEPVYTVRGLHLPCENDKWWAIIHTFPNCEFAHFIAHGKEFSADFEDYGVRWLAYRHKPMHIVEANEMQEEEPEWKKRMMQSVTKSY